MRFSPGCNCCDTGTPGEGGACANCDTGTVPSSFDVLIEGVTAGPGGFGQCGPSGSYDCADLNATHNIPQDGSPAEGCTYTKTFGNSATNCYFTLTITITSTDVLAVFVCGDVTENRGETYALARSVPAEGCMDDTSGICDWISTQGSGCGNECGNMDGLTITLTPVA